MLRFVAKSAFGAAKAATKYVIVPIAYVALLGYLMQEAADRMRDDGHQVAESPVAEELQPAP